MIPGRKLAHFSLWVLTVGVCALAVIHSDGQQSTTPRKILERKAPAYPALARGMALQGIVKVDATVGPDGTVKDVAIKGGHPVLAQAAANAVRQWRWEPTAHESHEVVDLKFSPSD